MKKNPKVTPSTGSVFADLGVSEPEEAKAKADLAIKISELIEARGLSQTAAAKVLGVDQPKVSALLRGRLESFSTDRLLRFVTALGSDVEIVIRRARTRGARGHLHVVTT